MPPAVKSQAAEFEGEDVNSADDKKWRAAAVKILMAGGKNKNKTKRNAFEDHRGRPGLRGGSLPRSAGTGPIGVLKFTGHNAPGLMRYNLRDDDYETYKSVMELDSEDAQGALERAGYSAEEAREEIGRARAEAANLPQTRDRYIDADGKYTPERQALHDQIKNEFISKGKAGEEKPELFMTGGLPGAGKSSVLKKEAYAGYKDKFVVIDSDNIKEMLAKADGLDRLGIHAASYHAEADDIIHDIFNEAIEKKMNIGLDGTMKNSSKMLSMVNAFKQRGYRIEVAFVDLPPEKAMLRGVERYLRGGRFVDPIYIASNDALNPRTAYLLRDEVDVWRFWSNDVPYGQSPILVDEKVN